MKITRLIMISVCLLVSVFATAQSVDTVEVYYNYELTPTGRVLNGVDTVYSVVLVMDSIDMKRYTRLSFESGEVKREISLLSSELTTNPRIEIQEKTYKLDMEEWSNSGEFHVTAEKPDGSKVMLQHRSTVEATTHRVLTLKRKTRDLTFYEGEPIVEPVPFVEPEPVQPDTTLIR